MSMPDPSPFKSKGVHGNPGLEMVKPEVGEYPKWIEPNPSHVVKSEDGRNLVVDHECNIDRDNKLTILVVDKDDEAKMLAPKKD